jgi:hypothetical protein
MQFFISDLTVAQSEQLEKVMHFFGKTHIFLNH